MSACWRFWIAAAVFACVATSACDDHYDLEDERDRPLGQVRVDQSFLRDDANRYVFLHGANLSGSTKFPAGTDPISYVGKPFDLADAEHHFAIMRKLGFNVVRFLVIWEGVEPYASGEYDEAYLDYIEKVVRLAGENGLYVFLDMHQDFFSRHLVALFDDGGDELNLYDKKEIALAEQYGLNNRVGGDGAPAWAVKACLPEKFVGGPEWGLPFWLGSSPRTVSDVIPFQLWGVNIFISLDVNRCFAAMLAGREVYPHYTIEGKNVQDYLQDSYANAWRQIAKRVKDLPNVLGYDLMNEPAGLFIRLPIQALLYREAKSAGGKIGHDRAMEIVNEFLDGLVEGGLGAGQADLMREAFMSDVGLPTSLDEIEAQGFAPDRALDPWRPELDAALAINSNFNKTHLQPFYAKVGGAILEEDPDAIMFIEQALGAMDRGIGGQWAEPMTRPEGFDQMVYAPHYYTDIYPHLGVNAPPREFTPEEKWLRDYRDAIADAIEPATFSLGNPPVLMGEFGTYFNFGGIEESMANDYLISTLVLNPYYEAYDEMLVHRTVWCYSPENTAENGDGWNREDFSVLGPDGQPRSWQAYSRAVPRATAGRLTSMYFHSPVHYFEPRPGEQTPYLEFHMEMAGVETSAPTEIFVPPLQYTDGFYVKVSDGRCEYDPERFVLYWHVADDAPGAVHAITINPPYAQGDPGDWDYFFRDDEVLER